MKTKLLKKLRKAAKKEYILVSDYPKFELHIYFYNSKKYTRYAWYDTLEEAMKGLKLHRRKTIEEAIKRMKDEKLNKEFRKI